MKITKHGKTQDALKLEDFKCESCGCEFTASKDEYYIIEGSEHFYTGISSYTYTTEIKDCYITGCPECHRIVKQYKTRTISNPCITATTTSNSRINIKPTTKGE